MSLIPWCDGDTKLFKAEDQHGVAVEDRIGEGFAILDACHTTLDGLWSIVWSSRRISR